MSPEKEEIEREREREREREKERVCSTSGRTITLTGIIIQNKIYNILYKYYHEKKTKICFYIFLYTNNLL